MPALQTRREFLLCSGGATLITASPLFTSPAKAELQPEMPDQSVHFCTPHPYGRDGVHLVHPSNAPITYQISKTPEEWAEILTSHQFKILREGGTERRNTSDLIDEKGDGLFLCAGCDAAGVSTPVYSSDHKFESGTGWPSFWRTHDMSNVGCHPEDPGIKTKLILELMGEEDYTNIELHCMTCGSHMGHILDDAPKELGGYRHCINGAALVFEPTE